MRSECSITEANEILELPNGASLEAAEAAYRRLAVQVHPDRFQNNSKMRSHAEEEQRKLNEAIRILRVYLKASRHQSTEARPPKSEPPRPSRSEPSRPKSPPPPAPEPTAPPRSERQAPPFRPEAASPPPSAEAPAPPPTSVPRPTGGKQMWGLFCLVFAIAKIAMMLHGSNQEKAEPQTNSQPAAANPASGAGNESSQASQGLPEPTAQQGESPTTAAPEGRETYHSHGSYPDIPSESKPNATCPSGKAA